MAWNIWKARNSVIFRNKIFDMEEIFDITKVEIWNWINRKYGRERFS